MNQSTFFRKNLEKRYLQLGRELLPTVSQMGNYKLEAKDFWRVGLDTIAGEPWRLKWDSDSAAYKTIDTDDLYKVVLCMDGWLSNTQALKSDFTNSFKMRGEEDKIKLLNDIS